MALTRLNNRSVSAVTALPSGIDIPAGTILKADLPSASILQVLQASKTDTTIFNAVEWADVPSLSITITPTASTSKFLIIANLATYNSGGGSNGYRIARNGSAIGVGDANGSRPRFGSNSMDGGKDPETITTFMQILDTPNTSSSITYKVQAFSRYSGNLYINRAGTYRDNLSYDATSASFITVIEIAG